jgi:hypothetical protein
LVHVNATRNRHAEAPKDGRQARTLDDLVLFRQAPLRPEIDVNNSAAVVFKRRADGQIYKKEK